MEVTELYCASQRRGGELHTPVTRSHEGFSTEHTGGYKLKENHYRVYQSGWTTMGLQNSFNAT